MFYFFQKGREYVRCEIQSGMDGTFELLITGPEKAERTENYLTSQQAEQRWNELQAEFATQGWKGPFGRE